ncbi:DUF92 domain-containing protein [Marinococcus luteus]|uniref:DUF92 domain-containing protein n=1 Tax=Marinococcus luteus TaxID=1122204 RepID=UPI002ACC77AD|nr:DUF92 domain-containing protein [Marinococcus luteus]MDZ5782982.1 DUF92 domain-containing protein [Marinococcus luteus]
MWSETALGLAFVLFLMVIWQKGSLTFPATVSAGVLGTLMYTWTGWLGAAALLTFFVSSTVLSRLNKQEKEQRDSGQVWANGGPMLIFAALSSVASWEGFLAATVGAAAASNADTWASEIGRRFGGRPFHVHSRKRIEIGFSGAVSGAGTLGAFGGALLVGGVVYFISSELNVFMLIAVSAAGVCGCFIDTFLGAYVERMNRCSVCGSYTEAEVHHERETIHAAGIPWMTNNAVNALSSFGGGMVVVVLYIVSFFSF